MFLYSKLLGCGQLHHSFIFSSILSVVDVESESVSRPFVQQFEIRLLKNSDEKKDRRTDIARLNGNGREKKTLFSGVYHL